MIQGQRILLRAIDEADLPLMAAWLVDPDVTRWTGGFAFPIGLPEQREWFRKFVASGGSGGASVQRWIIEHEGQAVGLSGLWDIDRVTQSAQSAIKLGKEARGKGIARDALRTTAAYAFEQANFHRLWADILEFNGPSLRLYTEGCGFRIEGALRESVFRDGRFWSQYRLGLLRDEFRAFTPAAPYLPKPVTDLPKPNPAFVAKPFWET